MISLYEYKKLTIELKRTNKPISYGSALNLSVTSNGAPSKTVDMPTCKFIQPATKG